MKKIISAFAFVTLVTCAFLNTSFAQENRIEPDRPDQAESPKVIPVNTFQVEAGVVYEKNSQEDADVNNLSYPSLLLRYGLLSNLELRMEVENTKITTESNGTSSSINGINPVSLGVKMNLREENGLSPAVGFIVNFSLPNLASKNFKKNYVGTSVNLALQNSFTDDFSAGYNLGASWDGNTPEPTFFYTLSLDYELSKRFSGFVEVYGFLPEKTRADHRFDFGLTFFAKNNLALDASAGLGITDNAPTYFINGGISFRLPK
ncbi:MAG: transporter [Ignavibacteriota bacterium]|nr:transporter [Ignavibacteriota bacterium]